MGFADEVKAEVREGREEIATVFRYSVQDLVELVTLEGPSKGPPPGPGFGGRMPVQLGNLRRSLRSSTASMPQINPSLTDNVSDGLPEVIMSIAGFELGGTFYLGFTSAYAMRVNYGFSGVDSLGRSYDQDGYHFVEWARDQWPEIVARNDARHRGSTRR